MRQSLFPVLLFAALALGTLVGWPAASRAGEAAPSSPAVTAEQEKFFEERVRPVLSARCWKCHGAEKQESNLRLDRREGLLAATSGGAQTVVPGDPAKSLLLSAVRRDGDVQMPPDEKDKLTPAEIEALTGRRPTRRRRLRDCHPGCETSRHQDADAKMITTYSPDREPARLVGEE